MGMNKKIGIISASVVALLLPAIGLAQPGVLTLPVTTVVDGIINVGLYILWAVAVAFVIIMFSIAGFKYLTAEGQQAKIDEANKAVIWGTVGTAVVVLAWSIVSLVRVQIGV